MTMFNLKGLKVLKQKADSFRDRETISMKTIPNFFRNKPPGYFQEILDDHDGQMRPYRKDKNGDSLCPASGRIRGIFFTGRRDKYVPSMLPQISNFGSKRVIVPSRKMFHSEGCLYFCDFYCHNSEHYVTLVLTVPGTDAHTFCEQYLLKLDNYANGYLELSSTNSEVSTNQNLWVEILYTEAVDIKDADICWQENCGSGQSTPMGIPKRPNCSDCHVTGDGLTMPALPELAEDMMSVNRVPIGENIPV